MYSRDQVRWTTEQFCEATVALRLETKWQEVR
jgi:hypothetical protein